MGRCRECGRRGLFLRTNEHGLCAKCEHIRINRKKKQQELAEITAEKERQIAQELEQKRIVKDRAAKRKQLEEAISLTPFSRWNIETHTIGRRKRIDKSKYLSVKNYDVETGIAEILNHPYETFVKTTLRSCTCYDFNDSFMPCKHIYHMAFKYGGIDRELLLEVCDLNEKKKPRQYHDYGSDDFAIDNDRALIRWDARVNAPIEKALLLQNPDKIIAAYSKAFKLLDEFKEWCEERVGGDRWFLFEGMELESRLEDALETFIIDDYDGMKYLQTQDEKRAKEKNKLKREVIEFIGQNPSSTRKEIYLAFPNTPDSKLLKLLNELVKAKIVLSEKISGRVTYKL